MAVSWEKMERKAETVRRSRRRWWIWLVAFLAILAAAAFFAVRHVLSHAEPILRARVIETLSTRFKSRVELAELHVSLQDGVGVSGSGLKIFGLSDPNPSAPGVQPLLEVKEFHFGTGVRELFAPHIHVHAVGVKGMVLNLPPREDRAQYHANTGKMKMSIFVDEFICEDTQLIINTRKPGKDPLAFEISRMVMRDLGPDQPMSFDATLVNPKPVGDIQSQGHFGPFQEASPRETPVDGDYSFTNADLGTLKGIGGILSSTGKYRGTLGRIEVEGSTDTPDFHVTASGGHTVNLHTDFHAIVDGTDGDTYLEPVNAKFLHSSFTAKGKVVRMKNPSGHDIELSVVMQHARVEDLLKLGVKTDPPVMSGEVSMNTKLSLQPGPDDVAERLKLNGSFEIPAGVFSNAKVQERIDSLSLRSQGEPKLAKEHAVVGVPSDLAGTFRLDRGLLTFDHLHFAVPGTHADLDGQYSLDGQVFDFHGTLRLEAKVSQMTTGWKSILLKPVDPFFSKNGAGTEVPFKVTGTHSAPRFGLDFGYDKDKDKDKDKADREQTVSPPGFSK